MKVTAESTEKIVQMSGVPARIWEAVTESGIRCHLYVIRVAVELDQDSSQFDRALQKHKSPSPEIAAIPLRWMIL